MFQVPKRETIDSTWKVAVSFKIIMTTRPCFTTQHQTCKTKTAAYSTKTKTDFLAWDRSCPKTDCLRPHHYKWAVDYVCEGENITDKLSDIIIIIITKE